MPERTLQAAPDAVGGGPPAEGVQGVALSAAALEGADGDEVVGQNDVVAPVASDLLAAALDALEDGAELLQVDVLGGPLPGVLVSGLPTELLEPTVAEEGDLAMLLDRDLGRRANSSR